MSDNTESAGRPLEGGEWNGSVPLRVHAKLRYLKVADDLYVYERTVKSVTTYDAKGSMKMPRSALTGLDEPKVNSGFIDHLGLNLMRYGYEVEDAKPPKEGKSWGEYRLVSPEFLRAFAERGWMPSGYHDTDISSKALTAMMSTTPYRDLEADPSLVARIVRLGWSDMTLRDAHGRHLPVAIHINMHSEQCDLERVAEFLIGRDDVRLDARVGRGGVVHTAHDAMQYTYDEEGNARERMEVEFRWSPSVEACRAMWVVASEFMAQGVTRTEVCKRAVFELDLIGFKAAGLEVRFMENGRFLFPG